jgi:hypothetical protein
MEINNPVASWTLWCRRDDLLIEFKLAVATPHQDADSWICEWSMGNLFPHSLAPAIGVSSMHSLVCAFIGLRTFLNGREELGDKFYCGSSSEENLVERIEDLFWSSSPAL